MERVRELNAELAFPSAKRLQSALLREGINIPIAEIKDIVSKTGSRQVLQPPPSYKGNITSGRIDDRWAADLLSFESRPARSFKHVLLVRDIFSRFLWAEPISTNNASQSCIRTDRGTHTQRAQYRQRHRVYVTGIPGHACT